MFNIATYKYNCEPNKLNKIGHLTPTGDYKGVLNGEFNVLTPVVRFRTNEPVSFNYAFIPALGNRYYFVESIKQDGNLCTVQLKIDVLMTYRENILKSTGTLIGGENTDKYNSSRNEVYDVRPQIKRFDFPNTGLFNEDGNIIMVTIKGK